MKVASDGEVIVKPGGGGIVASDGAVIVASDGGGMSHLTVE